MAFPGGPGVKKPPAKAGDMRLDPWSGKFPHALGQVRPCATASEAWCPQHKSPPPGEAHTPQPEKARQDDGAPPIKGQVQIQRNVKEGLTLKTGRRRREQVECADAEQRWGERVGESFKAEGAGRSGKALRGVAATRAGPVLRGRACPSHS